MAFKEDLSNWDETENRTAQLEETYNDRSRYVIGLFRLQVTCVI